MTCYTLLCSTYKCYCTSSNDPEPGPGDQIRTERFPFSIASPGLIPDPIPSYGQSEGSDSDS